MPNDTPDRPSKPAREASRLPRQDQRHDPHLAEQERPLINMGELASSITTAPAGPLDYAPPARRMERHLAELASHITGASVGPNEHAPPARRIETSGALAVRTVESFSELPTTELDDMIRAVKGEIAKLETEAAEIRSTYVSHTDRLATSIKRLATACELAKETLVELREQCATLAEPPAPAQKRPDQGGQAVDKGT